MIWLHPTLLSLVLLGTPALEPEVSPAGSKSIHACVTPKAEGDALSPVDHVVLHGALEDLLVTAGRTLSAPPCHEPWAAEHTRQGGGLVVTVSARGRQVSGFAASTSSIPPIYRRLVAALISGAEVPPWEMPQDRVSPTGVPSAPMDRSGESLALPRRENAPWYIYLSAGLGAAPSLLEDASASSCLGYRYSVDHWGLDLSSGVLTVNAGDPDLQFSSSGSGALVSRTLLRLRALYTASPKERSSFYALGGVGWGGIEAELVTSNFDVHRGDGFEVSAAIGREFRRKKSFRYAVELGVTWPIYSLEADFGGETLEVGPLIMATVGLGWSPAVYKRSHPGGESTAPGSVSALRSLRSSMERVPVARIGSEF